MWCATTIEALAAVLGGTQSLHTNARDEAIALPTEESALLALRTQQIIAYESGVTAEPDPLGGSYYIESLTDQLEQQAAGISTRSTTWADAQSHRRRLRVQGNIPRRVRTPEGG